MGGYDGMEARIVCPFEEKKNHAHTHCAVRSDQHMHNVGSHLSCHTVLPHSCLSGTPTVHVSLLSDVFVMGVCHCDVFVMFVMGMCHCDVCAT